MSLVKAQYEGQTNKEIEQNAVYLEEAKSPGKSFLISRGFAVVCLASVFCL
jgi:hypothetical protein